MPLPLQVAFVAGSSGMWRIERITAVAGESLPPAERLVVIEGPEAQQCLVGIEAGMATHYMARELVALGHVVKQVPPAFAKPFRQGHKNDFRDAYAIAEAVQRPSTRCVPIKTDDQLDLQSATSGAFAADRRSDSS